MYYSLGPNAREKNSMSKIANYYECKESSIRKSISSIKCALYYIPEKELLLIKKLLEDKYEF